MIRYDDIKDILTKTSLKTIDEAYNQREKEALEISNSNAQKFLNGFDLLPFDIKNYIDYENPRKTVAQIIRFILKGPNEELKEQLINYLNRFGYNPNHELIIMMQYDDQYFSQELSFEMLKLSVLSLTTLKGVNTSDDKMLINALFPNTINMIQASSEAIAREKRIGLCHYMTDLTLKNFPNLYGAYFYITDMFGAKHAHSVAIDIEKGIIIDPANNIVLKLKHFRQYYPHIAFMIKGSIYNEYRKRLKDEFGICIDPIILEEVRRRTKKNKYEK